MNVHIGGGGGGGGGASITTTKQFKLINGPCALEMMSNVFNYDFVITFNPLYKLVRDDNTINIFVGW